MNGEHRLVASTSEVSFITDAHGRIESWNAAAERYFEVPAREAIGRRCCDLIRGRDEFGNDFCTAFCAPRHMNRAGRAVNRFRIRIRDRDGGERHCSVSTVAISAAAGEGAALLHILTPESAAAPSEPAANVRGESAAGLTPREREVLKRVLDGRGTRDIADLLGISARTVENHLQNIYRKHGVRNRVALVSLLLDPSKRPR
jgi:PAS domain S-box-containing protein